jgi:hypothetical protein
LEHIITTLRTGSADEANQALQRLRASDDAVQFNQALNDATASGPAEVPKSSSDAMASGHAEKSSINNPALPQAASLIQAQEPESSSAHHRRVQVDAQMCPANVLDQRPNLSFSAARGLGLSQPPLPDPSVTEQAIDSFFRCSGKLFHVYTKEEISQYCRAIFGTQGTLTEDVKAKVCSVMSVSSVGAQYLPHVFSKDVEVGFYDLAKHFFEAILEQDPYQAIKACTLLAQYNIMSKSTVSLAYVG